MCIFVERFSNKVDLAVPLFLVSSVSLAVFSHEGTRNAPDKLYYDQSPSARHT